jgi:hypothetical protein
MVNPIELTVTATQIITVYVVLLFGVAAVLYLVFGSK